MVAGGVILVLGYKISELNMRELFNQNSDFDLGSDSNLDSDSSEAFDACEFQEFFENKILKKYAGIESYRLRCCAYTECSDWIIGVTICYFDGYNLEPVESADITRIIKYKEKISELKNVFKKLNLGSMCDKSTPNFYTIADDCQRCT